MSEIFIGKFLNTENQCDSLVSDEMDWESEFGDDDNEDYDEDDD